MKRIKLKPTVMDLLFLLLIAVSCLYLYFGYTKSPTLADSYKELDIIIESEPIKRTFAEKATPRLSVCDGVTGERLGSITEASIVEIPKTNDESTSALSEDMCILRLTIRCRVKDDNGYYLRDGRRILVGDSGEFITTTLYFRGSIKGFTVNTNAPQINPFVNGIENGGIK